MKRLILISLVLVLRITFAQSLPVFSLQPTNQTVSPGSTVTFTALATGATSYQWLSNGTNISGATNATAQVVNVQANNSGYYLVIAKNSTGWMPSQLTWLSVVGSNGIAPFSNIANSNSYNGLGQAISSVTGQPINGSAQIMAGPALDQMTLKTGSANKATVTNGWFNPTVQVFDGIIFYTTNKTVLLPTVAAGQTSYYSVYITYTNNSIIYTQQSAVISIIAGGNGFQNPSLNNLLFPYWIEWPTDPWVSFPNSSSSQMRVTGETFSLTNAYTGDTDLGTPFFQWRKNGVKIGSAQYFIPVVGFSEAANGLAVLTITNAQPSDAGVYDVDVRGNNWFIGQKIYVSIQTTNGQGVFQKPKFLGTNFVSDLVGAAGRNYKVQQSTNLLNWSDLVTLSNVIGTVIFTNPPMGSGSRFYRTVLEPQ